jgi:hypothetical protein
MIFYTGPSKNSKPKRFYRFLKCLLPCVFLFCATLSTSAQINLKGNVVDQLGRAVPFVRIGIVETTVALMSDVEGLFQLEVPEQLGTRQLVFQVPGYKTSAFAIDSLRRQDRLQIVLEEDITVLNDFVVSNRKLKTSVIGNDGRRKGSDVDNDFKGDVNMAYAIRVKGKKTLYKITRVWAFVRNPYEYPYYVRPLIMNYNEGKGKPGKDLIEKNIYFEVEKGNGWIEMNLEGHEIYAEGPIVIGVEWLGTSGEIPYFSISFDFGKAESFHRTMTSEGFKGTGKSNWYPYNDQRKRPLIKAEIQY